MISSHPARAFLAVAAVVAMGTIAATAAHAQITISNFTEGGGDCCGGGGNQTISTMYDASAADKLVVVLGGEHGFPGNTGGNFNSVTYGGTPLTEVVQEGAGIPTAAMFYLDDPGPAGDIVVNQENHNGTQFGIYELTGTAPGVGDSNKSTTNSVGLTTTEMDSLVIAAILNAGPNGGNGAPNMAADSPLMEDTMTDLEAGSRWVSFSTGSTIVGTPGPGNFSFSNANSTDLLATVGAEFTAAVIPEPASIAIWSLIGLGLAGFGVWRARRKK